MRVAEICPNCNTYINATCIIYDGDTLPYIGATALDSLDMILAGINSAIPPLSGSGIPTSVPEYIGQIYIRTDIPTLFIGLSISTPNWGNLGSISTTTTTTTA